MDISTFSFNHFILIVASIIVGVLLTRLFGAWSLKINTVIQELRELNYNTKKILDEYDKQMSKAPKNEPESSNKFNQEIYDTWEKIKD